MKSTYFRSKRYLRLQVEGHADGVAAGILVAAQQHGGVAAQAARVADRHATGRRPGRPGTWSGVKLMARP